MKKTKWIESVRNRLCDIFIECNAYNNISEAEMSSFQRNQLQRKIKEVIGYIDTKAKD